MAMPAHDCGSEPLDHDEDLAQHAVLTILLDAHPAQRSIDEVVRELTDRPDDFAERDRIDNAIRDLVRAGLVHRNGAFVFASRVTVRLLELMA